MDPTKRIQIWHLNAFVIILFTCIIGLQWPELSRGQVVMWTLFLGVCLMTIRLCNYFVLQRPLQFIEELIEDATLENAQAQAQVWLNISQSAAAFEPLSRFIGLTLQRLEVAEAHLMRTENVHEQLLRDIPIGLIDMDPDGTIMHSNLEAMHVFAKRKTDKGKPRELPGMNFFDLLKEYDRLTCEHSLKAIDQAQVLQLELQLTDECLTSDVLVKFSNAALPGEKVRIRVAIQDVSKLKHFQRRLNQKSDLLNMIVDNVSDALLMTGPSKKILAMNQSMTRLLNLKDKSLIGTVFDSHTFWRDLEIEDFQNFLSHLKMIEVEPGQAFSQRVDTREGRLLFACTPIYDRTNAFQGQLWSISDITNERQKQSLLQQQTRQLLSTRHISQSLSGIVNIDDLLMQTTRSIRDCLNVEMVGMALRYHGDWFQVDHQHMSLPDIEPANERIINHAQNIAHDTPESVSSGMLDNHQKHQQRTRQMLAGPLDHMMWPQTGQVMKSVEMHLMSQVMNRDQVSLWSELSPNEPWAAQFHELGLTSLAGVPIRGAQSAQGIVWIAREAARPIESSELYLLETLSPIIAARLEVALLFERMNQLQLTDTMTMMPNNDQMAKLTSRWIQAGRELSVIFIGLNWPGCHYPLSVRHRFIQTLGRDLPRLLRPMDLVAHSGPSELAIVLSEIDPQEAKEMKSSSASATNDLTGEISMVNRQAIVEKITSRLRNRILLVHEREKRRGNLPSAGLSLNTTSLQLPEDADNWLLARDKAMRMNDEDSESKTA